MPSEPVPLATLTVAARCREETQAFQRRHVREAPHCYELFRRALVTDDPQAWAALYDLYGALIVTWGRCPGLDDEDVLHETWARFLRYMPATAFTQRFPHIGAVLGYLKRCALTVRQEAGRRWVREQRLQVAAAGSDPPVSPAEVVVQQLVGEETRARVRSHLHDESERLVLYLTFVEGLPPRDIAARHPKLFRSPKAVSQVKERLLRRMAHDPALERLWRDRRFDA